MKKNIYKGTPLSAGIGVGKSLLLERQLLSVFRIDLKDKDIEPEVQRLQKAIDKTRTQISNLKEQLEARLGAEHAYILDAQMMMLADNLLIGSTIETIRKEKVNAEWALNEASANLASIFANMKDEYLRERVSDVEDLINRLQANLAQIDVHEITQVDEDVIIVAFQLSPSNIVEINAANIAGFVTELGGKTSHTAIIARSLETPAISGIEHINNIMKSGQQLIVDGYEGILIVNPTATQLTEYQNKKRYYEEHATILMSRKDLPAVTTDGKKIFIQANIELPDEIETAVKSGAMGIGLYRSEFLYLSNPDRLPTEEEHFEVYRKVAETVYPNSAIIRTADLGAEKFTPVMGMSHEPNPALGLRGIRFCLKKKDLFKTQLRAMLRASVFGRLKIMFPMVTQLGELREAKALLEEAKEELRRENQRFNEDVAVGIMIEVPAAAMAADLLAPEVDFFTIGTNDLIQYLLATDRNNDHLSYLYDPIHPAMIRCMKFVVEKAHEAGVKVGICGEMASDPQYLILLLGLGFDELSMNPVSIPLIKQMIRAIAFSDAKQIIENCLGMPTAQEINEYLLEKTNQFFPSGFFSSRGNRML